jgi:hypothetical protein
MPKAFTETPEFKKCKACQQVKPSNEYGKPSKRHIFSLNSDCNDCKAKRSKAAYEADRTRRIEKSGVQYAANRAFFRSLKDNQPCLDCGVRYPYYVLDYDHREPDMKRIACSNVGRNARNTVLAEISKCDLVCANCHRERTHRQRVAGLIKVNPKRYL